MKTTTQSPLQKENNSNAESIARNTRIQSDPGESQAGLPVQLMRQVRYRSLWGGYKTKEVPDDYVLKKGEEFLRQQAWGAGAGASRPAAAGGGAGAGAAADPISNLSSLVKLTARPAAQMPALDPQTQALEQPSPLKNPINYVKNKIASAGAITRADVVAAAKSGAIGAVPIVGPAINAYREYHKEGAAAAAHTHIAGMTMPPVPGASAAAGAAASVPAMYAAGHAGKKKDAVIKGVVGTISGAAGQLVDPTGLAGKALASGATAATKAAINVAGGKMTGGNKNLSLAKMQARTQKPMMPAEFHAASAAASAMSEEQAALARNEVVPFRPMMSADEAARMSHLVAGNIPGQAWGPETDPKAHTGREAELRNGQAALAAYKPGGAGAGSAAAPASPAAAGGQLAVTDLE